MATWFEITYTGEPTEADYARVAEMAAQGFTSGELINDGGPSRPIVCRCRYSYETEDDYAGHQSGSNADHWRVTPYPGDPGY